LGKHGKKKKKKVDEPSAQEGESLPEKLGGEPGSEGVERLGFTSRGENTEESTRLWLSSTRPTMGSGGKKSLKKSCLDGQKAFVPKHLESKNLES